MSEEARNKTLKQEQKIMFMDSSCLDDDQKAYVSAMRAQILKARMTHLWVGFQVVSQEVRAKVYGFMVLLLLPDTWLACCLDITIYGEISSINIHTTVDPVGHLCQLHGQ